MNTEELKKVLKWSQVVLVVLAIFLGAQALGSLKGLGAVEPVYNSISVNGEGEVVAIPDVATFSFAISVDANVVSDGQRQVTEKMDAILDGLKSMGIEENDIKTINYSIWPKYSFEPTICSPTFCPPSRQVQDGYTISHNVSVKVRKTEEAGSALALVGENGATNISSISFTVDDMEEVLDEARAKAIADAKDKAKNLAKELDVRLVRVVSYHDNNQGGPVPYYQEGFGGDAVRDLSQGPAPKIPVGENKVVMNVTVIYEIR